MTLSDFRPACERAGANRSGRVTHQSTFPRVRAAMPAVNSAAAATSMAPFPPPATSCSAPTKRPPPGKPRVHSSDPKGKHRCGAPAPAFDLPDLDAQGLDGGRGPHVER